MDSTAVLISLISALGVAVPTIFASTLVPLLMKRAENRARAEERAEDRASLREAARKAAQVAEQAKIAASILAENTAKAEAVTQTLVDKVDIVHVLVNSNLTVATEKLLEAKMENLALLVAYNAEDPSKLKVLELEIAELETVLADRRVQAMKVDALQKQQAKA